VIRGGADDGAWVGNAIAYGPHRDGQRPGEIDPSDDEIREDLDILARHWKLLRVYGSTGPAETLLNIIHDEQIDMRVMLGAWIAPEIRLDAEGNVIESLSDARAANREQVFAAIRLANLYPEIVSAVCVGNETQVYWSWHRSPPEVLIHYIQVLRERTRVPVTTADDYNFWNKPESQAVAREIDFIVMHAHPMWNGIGIEDAVTWTADTMAAIQLAHPNRQIVLGEAGWATAVHDEGEQARLIIGEASEPAQKIFHDAFTEWVERERKIAFFFEAFDEQWKGGDHPNEVEKHWGLYRSDRTPKAALAE
jgi:exo-beta-1,3-glucanase (GH17 family)